MLAALRAHDAKVLLVMPAGAETEAGLAVANMAVEMARTGRRAIAVDADLRRPSLHRCFGLANDEGVASPSWSVEAASRRRCRLSM